MIDEKIFATPRKVEDVADCYFYHTMELPGHGVIEGRDWDLRGRVDEYLGNVAFAGKRVLEIGPASGFLTFEMEKRGGEVISVEKNRKKNDLRRGFRECLSDASCSVRAPNYP